MVRELEAKSHAKQLKQHGMFSLKKRRLKRDTIVVFQHAKGCQRKESMNLFPLAPEGKMRTHGWKLYRERSTFKLKEEFPGCESH